MIMVHVDVKLMSGDCNQSLDLMVQYFQRSFKLRVDSKTEKCLEFSVHDSGDIVKFCNVPMIRRVLTAFRMKECKPAKTSLQQRLDFSGYESENLSDATPYQQLIGSLLHLASAVRQEIAFVIRYLSPFMPKPTNLLWRADTYVLRYLFGTEELGMVSCADSQGTVRAYSNADWGR